MSKKTCSTCGSDMGLGAPSDENVKIQYECWCGNIEVELFTDDELNLNRAAMAAEAPREIKPSSIPV